MLNQQAYNRGRIQALRDTSLLSKTASLAKALSIAGGLFELTALGLEAKKNEGHPLAIGGLTGAGAVLGLVALSRLGKMPVLRAGIHTNLDMGKAMLGGGSVGMAGASLYNDFYNK